MLFSQKFIKTAPMPLMRQELRVFIHDQHAVQDLADMLAKLLQELNPSSNRQTVLLAVGTDRSTGDSLGPLVGTRVKELAPGLLPIYGTLEEPVHAVNLKEKVQEIKDSFSHPLIIAVDACLGQLQSVGSINMGRGSLQPGTGVNKVLPPV